MKIYSVTDPEFKPYGKILEGHGSDSPACRRHRL